jgi:hypothetical protein
LFDSFYLGFEGLVISGSCALVCACVDGITLLAAGSMQQVFKNRFIYFILLQLMTVLLIFL